MEVNEATSSTKEQLEEAQQIIQEQSQQITTITQENNSLRQQIAELKENVAELKVEKFERTLFETQILNYKRRLTEMEVQLIEIRAASITSHADVSDEEDDDDITESRTKMKKSYRDADDFNILAMLFRNFKWRK